MGTHHAISAHATRLDLFREVMGELSSQGTPEVAQTPHLTICTEQICGEALEWGREREICEGFQKWSVTGILTSFEVSRERLLSSVLPEMTARAAATASTAPWRSTSCAADSLKCFKVAAGTLSKALWWWAVFMTMEDEMTDNWPTYIWASLAAASMMSSRVGAPIRLNLIPWKCTQSHFCRILWHRMGWKKAKWLSWWLTAMRSTLCTSCSAPYL